MRRRLVIMLAILLVAGFATNAAVAWYVLWKVHTGELASHLGLINALEQLEYHWRHVPVREQLGAGCDDTVAWSLRRTKAWGVLYLSSICVAPRQFCGLGTADREHAVLADVPRWAEKYLLVRDSDGTPMPRTEIQARRMYAAGFPMLSLYAVVDGNPDIDDVEVHGGIAIEHPSKGYQDAFQFVVPYRPLLIGLIVNTIFWAGVWSIPLAIVLGSRRLWRYERGRCPRCGYDLRRRFSDGCPECGWRRAARREIVTCARSPAGTPKRLVSGGTSH